MPGSLRVRLVLVFSIGAFAALAACLVLLYVLLDRQLWDALDTDLRRRADDLSAAVAQGDLGVLAADPMAQLYAPDGTVLTGSTSVDGLQLLRRDQVRAATGTAKYATESLRVRPGEGMLRVRLLWQRMPDGRVLAVGLSAAAAQDSRRRLLSVLLLAGPLLLGLTAAAGWLVVRAALRPVGQLTAEAAEISSLDIGRRLPEVPGDDEIARLARTLDDMLARLRVSFARERAFVDDASHELRTPIAVLRGEIELAMSAAGDRDEVERSLRAALREVERLSRLAEDLLLLARQRAGSLVIRSEPVDLADLVAAQSRALEPVLGLRIEAACDPLIVEADPDRLRQVLVNLAANSAAAGARVMRITAVREEDMVRLEVADDGPGFPAGLPESASERFVRGDEARTAGRSGAGLGLSIVQALVSAHHGRLELTNGGPLGGAVVTVRLPVNGG
ncbi:ATP-binding protein [Microtetraspora sp. NBRC 13810]|uniref:sensor histidine kinase n=1 Tax=Microtetraspora sp. NBRC 13810 TaxID=3030990 RepID=UPI00255565B5|nr:ATP-binding protein [Microtetraspora sp. NBRC 13810]